LPTRQTPTLHLTSRQTPQFLLIEAACININAISIAISDLHRCGDVDVAGGCGCCWCAFGVAHVSLAPKIAAAKGLTSNFCWRCLAFNA